MESSVYSELMNVNISWSAKTDRNERILEESIA